MNQESLDSLFGNSVELRSLCVDFFMAFSRFEFALKQNRFVRCGKYGQAEADWRAFRDAYAAAYVPCKAAELLLDAPPKQQVLRGTALEWRELGLAREVTSIGKVILIVKTIRNNLFHGGKHGIDDWDQPLRTTFLLSHGVQVLDEFAQRAGIFDDYERRY